MLKDFPNHYRKLELPEDVWDKMSFLRGYIKKRKLDDVLVGLNKQGVFRGEISKLIEVNSLEEDGFRFDFRPIEKGGLTTRKICLANLKTIYLPIYFKKNNFPEEIMTA